MNEFKYNIGYALSGGFIKGFAHLGIMQALHEHGIKPEILSGVSAGALAAVFYADGKQQLGVKNDRRTKNSHYYYRHRFGSRTHRFF